MRFFAAQRGHQVPCRTLSGTASHSCPSGHRQRSLVTPFTYISDGFPFMTLGTLPEHLHSAFRITCGQAPAPSFAGYSLCVLERWLIPRHDATILLAATKLQLRKRKPQKRKRVLTNDTISASWQLDVRVRLPMRNSIIVIITLLMSENERRADRRRHRAVRAANRAPNDLVEQ